MRGFSTLMGKASVEFEVQDICQTSAAQLRTGCEVVISLDPEGLLQVQVGSSSTQPVLARNIDTIGRAERSIQVLSAALQGVLALSRRFTGNLCRCHLAFP